MFGNYFSNNEQLTTNDVLRLLSWATCLILALALLQPTPALAQNECGVQVGDTVTCDPQDYPLGITYSSLGDLTLEVPDDSVDFTVNEAGVNVTGNGADNVSWDSGFFTSGQITGTGVLIDYLSGTGDIDIGTGGIVMGMDDATHAIRAESTGGGDVNVTAQGDVNVRQSFGDPDPSGTGIEALTNGGNITIDSTGEVWSGRAGGQYGIHAASSAGGNIDIDVARVTSPEGSHGILAETSGGGDITINSTDLVSVFGGSGNLNAVAGIEAMTDTGDIVVNAGNLSGPVGLIAETGGAGTIMINSSGDPVLVSTENGAITYSGDSGGSFTSLTGDISIDGGGSLALQTDGLMTVNNNNSASATVTSASGDTQLQMNITGEMQGSLPTEDYNTNNPAERFEWGDVRNGSVQDLTGLTGGAQINFGSHTAWLTGDGDDSQVLSDAADVVTTAEHSLVYGIRLDFPNWGSNPLDNIDIDRYGVDFGGGDDVFNMGGLLIAGSADAHANSDPARKAGVEGEYRFENLETFNLLSTGVIYLGAGMSNSSVGDKLTGTDLWPDDILAMPGTHWHGEGGQIFIDMNLNSTSLDGQDSCDTSDIANVRNAVGDLPSADCIDLTGGQVTGRSFFVVNQMIPGDRGAYNPEGVVIVDVSGSTAENDPLAFGISPDSPQYSIAAGENGAVDKGLFLYLVGYDADAQQYRLFGLEAPASQRLPLMAHAVHNLWRSSTAGWFERQGGDRNIGGSAELGGGFWARVSRESADHDVKNTIIAGTTPFVFDNSYEQDNTTITLGLDLIDRQSQRDDGGSDGWLAGVMLGYARGEVEFNTGVNDTNLEGPSVGAYASYVNGPWFVDAAINGTWLDVRAKVPAFEFTPASTKLTTDIETLGGQVEAGWNLAFGRFGVTPLLGASYVSSEFDEISVPADDPTRFGGRLMFDDPASLRGSLGIRLSADDLLPGGAVRTDASLTARAVQESDGESKVTIENLGPIPANVENTFDGSFTEVNGALSMSNQARTAVGYLNLSGQFGDDYDSLGLSAGFRYQW